jgi:hypothetical protein
VPFDQNAARPRPVGSDERDALWDLLRSIDALADMPRHVVRAYVRAQTTGWAPDRARGFARTVQTMLRLRREYGVIEAYPRGARPRWR